MDYFNLKKYLAENKLIEDISEEEMESFAEGRGEGAKTIADNAKEKGGDSMLTYHHFKVKSPYYKKASDGNFNKDEFTEDYKGFLEELYEKTKDGMNIEPVAFQELMGKIEVLGELLVENKESLNESKMPTQDQVDKFFALTQNEMHYLNSKPVAGQEKTFNKMEVKPWDEYDLSNFNALVRKAKSKGKLNEFVGKELEDSNIVPEAELILPRGKKVILQAEDTDYKRGLIVELLDNGGYEMAYWYDKPDKPYPVEILVDGQSIKEDGKVVEMKFHPQDYYDEQDKLKNKK